MPNKQHTIYSIGQFNIDKQKQTNLYVVHTWRIHIYIFVFGIRVRRFVLQIIESLTTEYFAVSVASEQMLRK